jgi:hypothetical protein
MSLADKQKPIVVVAHIATAMVRENVALQLQCFNSKRK